mmetsp:Transcript_67923/g.189696  ORF Transcript_67923/g.189696 Transcript_67923/m.189696 type:complete len:204 (+) Transcript_67923:158-769(+)
MSSSSRLTSLSTPLGAGLSSQGSPRTATATFWRLPAAAGLRAPSELSPAPAVESAAAAAGSCSALAGRATTAAVAPLQCVVAIGSAVGAAGAAGTRCGGGLSWQDICAHCALSDIAMSAGSGALGACPSGGDVTVEGEEVVDDRDLPAVRLLTYCGVDAALLAAHVGLADCESRTSCQSIRFSATSASTMASLSTSPPASRLA